MESKFGKSPQQWQTNVDMATGVLRSVANRRGSMTYKELASLIGPDVDHWRELSYVLGEISRTAHQADQPLLSAVVVKIEDRQPGIGFAGLARDLGIPVVEGGEVNFWIDQLMRCWEFWSR